MAVVLLHNGMHTFVDDADFDLVNQYRWTARESSSHDWYAARMFRSEVGRKVAQGLHTFLTGYPLTDHIDGDGLNNRRENLRLATRRENMQNRRKRRGTSSQYKGVNWAPSQDRWIAKIHVDGRPRHLGRFPRDREADAALAYDAAARRYFGEFAAVNFPRPGEQSALR